MQDSTDSAAPPFAAETVSGSKRPAEDEQMGDASELKKPKIDEDPAPAEASTSTAAEPTSSANLAEKKGKGKKKNQSRRTAWESRQQEKQDKIRRGTRVEGEEREDTGERGPRLPKRQCALLLGFCGSGYSGMQIQKDVRTIEGTLFAALVRAGAVSQDNADNPAKVNFHRAARTDAGVHAAGNLVSMKMITAIPGVPDLVAHINAELPPEIRLWNFLRVQNSFNARSTCDSRKYTYFFPSYLLIPPKPGTSLHKTTLELAAEPSEVHDFWKDATAESTVEDDLARKRQWKAPKDVVNNLREFAQKLEGSHNYHNFTVGQDFNDKSSQRFIKKIEIADPVVYGDTEWISVLLHGQSFMLHQRKMMSAMILACRTRTPPSVIDELYGPRIAFVPKMPALGLLLEYPIFDSYNKRIEATNSGLKPTDPEYRPVIDFEVYRETIEQFKQEHIYSRMRDIESRSGLFDGWIRSVDTYAGNDLLYLNPNGTLPDVSVLKKGERRTNPFREKKKFDSTVFPEGRDGKLAIEDEEQSEDEEEQTLGKKELAEMEG